MASALGTLTLVAQYNPKGPIYEDEVTLVGDAAYPTNGTAGLKAALQALTLDGRVPFHVSEGGNTNGFMRTTYDRTNDKVIHIVGAAGIDAEVGNGVDIHTTTFRLIVRSK